MRTGNAVNTSEIITDDLRARNGGALCWCAMHFGALRALILCKPCLQGSRLTLHTTHINLCSFVGGSFVSKDGRSNPSV